MASRKSSAGSKYVSEYFKSEVWFLKKESGIQCFTLYVIYIFIARCQDNSASEDESEVVVEYSSPDFSPFVAKFRSY